MGYINKVQMQRAREKIKEVVDLLPDKVIFKIVTIIMAWKWNKKG